MCKCLKKHVPFPCRDALSYVLLSGVVGIVLLSVILLALASLLKRWQSLRDSEKGEMRQRHPLALLTPLALDHFTPFCIACSCNDKANTTSTILVMVDG